MDFSTSRMAPQTSLFQVFLRLRPPMQQNQQQKQHTEPWLIVEPPSTPSVIAAEPQTQEDIQKTFSTHITLQPPNDSRKRAIERFGFTKVFAEDATQQHVFEEIEAVENIRGVLNAGRDGLIATLGVTGSGKSHTILGTKSQRGLTQMSLDVLFRSIGNNLRRPHQAGMPLDTTLLQSLQASDPSEAQIIAATTFLENMYSDGDRARYSRAQTPMTGVGSRAQTPMMVRIPFLSAPDCLDSPSVESNKAVRGSIAHPDTPRFLRSQAKIHASRLVPEQVHERQPWKAPKPILPDPFRRHTKARQTQDSFVHHTRKPPMPRPSTFASSPDMSPWTIDVDDRCDYAVIVSMYEVYNDRIFDLLSNSTNSTTQASSARAAALTKGLTRRPLLFKNTELSQERKVVAGLKKIVCSTYEDAMMVLETGLTERRVAGTGSNSVSSRSHGFFCIEVRKKARGNNYAGLSSDPWVGATLSIADLAGSERARNAKTTGSTLAEAGKINESLMYLGQCLQVQSDCQQDGTKPIVPFRQCKLTELLFSNSFPSSTQPTQHRQPQKAVMIVTADAQGDFNATSQILRYSALAREVTVPRIPSVTTAMGPTNKAPGSGRNTPGDMPNNYFSAQELDQAHHEISRLADECNALAIRLAEEEIRRTEAELKLQAAEETAQVAEQEIREECWNEMEDMIEDQKERWRQAWELERLSGQDYVDGKIEILEKTSSFAIHEDAPASTNERVDELERENDVLRAKLQALEQEMQTRSPTKKRSSKPSNNTRSPSKPILEESASSNIQPVTPFLDSLKLVATPRTQQPSLTYPLLTAHQLATAGSEIANSEDEPSLLSVADISPRKLSLRTSTLRTSVLANSPGSALGEVDEDGEPLVVEKSPKKKTRKLTTRKWEIDAD